MSFRVFYSWQSDLPNATNRGFIQTALEKAAKSIRQDESIQVEPVIDRDVQGVPGSPNIGETILAKIEESQAFVCDVSIINRRSKFRKTPNPNVLYELGYATRVLGEERIVMVVNTAYGDPDQLPFDLRQKLACTYYMPAKSSDRASERAVLKGKLEGALRQILEESAQHDVSPSTSPFDAAIESILGSRPDQGARVRDAMAYLAEGVNALAPDFAQTSNQSEREELLLDAIEESTGLTIEFSRLAQTVAEQDSRDAASAIYRDFGGILEGYNLPTGSSGYYGLSDFDFHKFIGHELFVTFFSFLIREERWALIGDLLKEGIYVVNAHGYGAEAVPFPYASAGVDLLDRRSGSFRHAAVLNERHTEGDLAEIVSMERLVEADFFLHLRTVDWLPWTVGSMYQVPMYLVEARSERHAAQLLYPLDVNNIPELCDLVAQRMFGDESLVPPRRRLNLRQGFDPRDIGTR